MDGLRNIAQIGGARGDHIVVGVPGIEAEKSPSAMLKTLTHRDGIVTWHSGLPVVWATVGTTKISHSRTELALKRLIDIVVSLVALVALAPLLVLVGVAVKISSPGPALFCQSREGLNGRRFNIYKFRSMRGETPDSSRSADNQEQENDARVTRVGRFIRRTSIDELPQLANVLLGDMSLVGPRPHVPEMLVAGRKYRVLVPYYDERLKMRPGITGWAQVNGLRGLVSNKRKAFKRVDHDIAYINNFSVLLDLKIIFKTLAREFLTGNGS